MMKMSMSISDANVTVVALEAEKKIGMSVR